MSTITVVAKKNGFRRAGFEFGSQPTEVDTSKLTEEQIKLLKSDPMLVVVEGSMVVSTADTQKLAAAEDALKQAQAELATEKEAVSELTKANEALQAKLAESEKAAKGLTEQLKDTGDRLTAAEKALAAATKAKK